jgi:hypothetical protein
MPNHTNNIEGSYITHIFTCFPNPFIVVHYSLGASRELRNPDAVADFLNLHTDFANGGLNRTISEELVEHIIADCRGLEKGRLCLAGGGYFFDRELDPIYDPRADRAPDKYCVGFNSQEDYAIYGEIDNEYLGNRLLTGEDYDSIYAEAAIAGSRSAEVALEHTRKLAAVREQEHKREEAAHARQVRIAALVEAEAEEERKRKEQLDRDISAFSAMSAAEAAKAFGPRSFSAKIAAQREKAAGGFTGVSH